MDSVSRRLYKELSNISSCSDHQGTIDYLAPVTDDSLMSWKGVLIGQDGTPYAGNVSLPNLQTLFAQTSQGGWFELNIDIPNNYPFSPPQITFVTPICHPNVHFKVHAGYLLPFPFV
jgi:peroxin-4